MHDILIAMDNAGDSIKTKNAQWSFSGDTAKNFDDHVSKSVPLYNEGQDLISEISDYFVSNGQNCYDIGCSTGVLTRKLAKRHQNKEVMVVGVDIEQDMIQQAQENTSLDNVTYECKSLFELEFKDTSFVSSYYTMQFVSPSVRQQAIDKIYESLKWGGAFVMFEKVRAPDARFQDYMNQLYAEYKLNNGYTPDNILSKSRSLKRILEPFSTQGNLDMLKRAGFQDIMSIQKYICFEGFLAIK